jgi:2-succinyl-6-hydroxy-2,4-cyclohexadiene-1-carboxylate synthase
MSRAAELVINLLDHYAIEVCHLIGYSMGGRLGLYLLTHYAERFDRSIIESASPGLKAEEERAARRKEDGLLADRLLIYGLDTFLDAWYRQPLFESIDKTKARFVEMLARRRRLDPPSLALSLRYMATGAQSSLWERLQETSVPILFIAGERDAKYSDLAHEMARLCPRGRTAILPGAGHNAHFERPDEFCRAVTEFLSQNG